MKKLLIFLIIATLTVSNAFGAQAIKKGQAAPADGVFFTSEEAQKLTGEIKEKDILEKLNLSLNNSLKYTEENNSILQEKNNILMDQNLKLVTSLRDARSVSNWERVMWFGLGVVGVGLATYGAGKLR